MAREKLTFAQKNCISSAGKAMQQTGMIYPGARVGVAVSGGVDSFVLLKTLRERQKIVPFHFSIIALHINPGFDVHNHDVLIPWLEKNGIAGHVECSDFGPVAHSEENLSRSPCFRCAWLRRKRLFELCGMYGLTHLAFGHNADDLVHTFFMNMCRNGRIDGMDMNESFFGGKLHVIRPLLLTEKKTIRAAAQQWKLPVWANPCPSSGHTSRSDTESMLTALYDSYSGARRCIFNALTRWQLEGNLPEGRQSRQKGRSGSEG